MLINDTKSGDIIPISCKIRVNPTTIKDRTSFDAYPLLIAKIRVNPTTIKDRTSFDAYPLLIAD